MPTRREQTYKPLLFTTTLRNPKRARGLLNIFARFDGQVLDDELAEKISAETVRYGLYRPTRQVTPDIEKKWGGKRIFEDSTIGIEVLSDAELYHIMRANPQEHKEAGFERGWPSRFATQYDLLKELGFVYYEPGEPIEFSPIGRRLADSVEIEVQGNLILFTDAHPEFEQQAFLNALAKYQRSNPFVRVRNENAPLILLLEVINLLNADPDFNHIGISKLELPLLIYWKDNDAHALYQRIKKLRQDFGYTPSWEVICEICREEIMQGQDSKRKDRSIILEYPDDFIRKMRLTGLFSLRGNGRFLDINKLEQQKVDYVLKTYEHYEKFDTERAYFEYASTIDENLITEPAVQPSLQQQNEYLDKWVNEYSWEQIKAELMILARKGLTTDEVLKYIPSPARLEFLTSVAVKFKYPRLNVKPNYKTDDEGLPTSTAGGIGNKGDIECMEGENGVLLEVTMNEGRSQTITEVWPIARHLKEFENKTSKSVCYFVAPSIYVDSVSQINYVRATENRLIIPQSIEEFIEHLENSPALHIFKS
jgi:hypothetical protein